jgi:hypothetical protein
MTRVTNKVALFIIHLNHQTKEVYYMELSTELILLLIPFILVQYGLMFFCIFKVLKEGVENLSKPAWLIILLLGGLVGSVTFLLIGRKKDSYDSY